MVSRISRTSLSSQATDALRSEIDRGTWSGVLPGERLLCERLGISRPTLRTALRVLHDEGRVEIAHGKPTRILGGTRNSTDKLRNDVRLLSPIPLHEMPPFMVCWVDKLRERLGATGQTMELIVHKKAFSGRPERALAKLVASSPPAAWILFLTNPVMQTWFAAQRIPCVVAGSVAPGLLLPSVDLDYRAICRHAAGFLKSKGRRNILLLLPSSEAQGDLESEAGFREAFPGAAEDPASRVLRHDESMKDLHHKLHKQLSGPLKADAFIVARSAHTLSVLTCLLREGICVPQGVALISRDDDAFLAHTMPAVARYKSDPDTWAKQLGNIVTTLTHGTGSPPPTVRLMPDFVRGESAG